MVGYTIEGSPITVSFGFDKATEFFLAVSDERYFPDTSAPG